jgi:hypothetical protein
MRSSCNIFYFIELPRTFQLLLFAFTGTKDVSTIIVSSFIDVIDFKILIADLILIISLFLNGE